MLDPRSLYTLADPSPDLVPGPAAMLVHALNGFVDAGSAPRLVADHLLATPAARGRRDLRRRPARGLPVPAPGDGLRPRPLRVLRAPRAAAVRGAGPRRPGLPAAARPRAGHPVGALRRRRDRSWSSTSTSSSTIGLHAIGMPVPHTRPLGVIGHANRSDLVPRGQSWPGTVQIPGSAAALLELRLGESGHAALGFVVQVPHYLADTPYPDAAAVLLDSLSRPGRPGRAAHRSCSAPPSRPARPSPSRSPVRRRSPGW